MTFIHHRPLHELVCRNAWERRALIRDLDAPTEGLEGPRDAGLWHGVTERDWVRHLLRGAGLSPEMPEWFGTDLRPVAATTMVAPQLSDDTDAITDEVTAGTQAAKPMA
jgi:hypothetical protein